LQLLFREGQYKQLLALVKCPTRIEKGFFLLDQSGSIILSPDYRFRPGA
jgi:hypothetical protein